MSWHLKRSFWTATLDRYPTSFKEDRERSSSLSRRPVGPVRPFLRRPSTNGVTLQTVSGSTITNLAVCSIAENPRATRSRSRSSEALIPWKPPRRHSFSGDSTSPVSTIVTKGHVLPLFTAPRAPRGKGISMMPFAMDIPDLSLRSNFAPPFVKDQTSSTTCTMCKYTTYSLECGHPAEDRLETGECSHFQRTGVPCDRENPAKRGRVNIKSEDRSGLCPKCHLRQREIAELEAMKRDEQRAKKQALAEAKEKEAALKNHEDNLFKEAAQEMARLEQEREEQQIAEALKQSQEEQKAVRLHQEQDDLAQALKASCVLDSEDIIIEPKREQARADSVQLLSPPATPIRATPPVRSPSLETPAKPVDYSLPAGQQEYGAYTLGGRRQPVHESQKQKAAKYLISTPSTPNSPAPIARLGGTIQPNSPSPRHVHTTSSPTPAPTDLRANLRRTGGPRKSMPSQSDAGTNPELDAFLARRRTWERNDETSSNVSITPSESASNLGTRPSSSGASDLSGASNKHDDSLIKNLDEKRRVGLRKD